MMRDIARQKGRVNRKTSMGQKELEMEKRRQLASESFVEC